MKMQQKEKEQWLQKEECQKEKYLHLEKDLRRQHDQELTQCLLKKAAYLIRKIVEVLFFLFSIQEKIWKNIYFTVRWICGNFKEWYGFLTSRALKKFFHMIKTVDLIILKHICPRKITGYVKFGFDDPALTGQILGVIGTFYPMFSKKLTVLPDFAKAKLEVDVKMKGRIFLIVLIVHIMKIERNKLYKKSDYKTL